jgi:formate-dependent nitrite reductase cytochrome c552 subunit
MYVAKHRPSCENNDRYIVIREVKVKENRHGAVVDNSDPGIVTSVKCADCHAPAHWK